MKYTISSTIPVVQYGNIIPSIEVEAETFEEARTLVLPEIEKLWAKYSEKPLPSKSKRKLIQAFVGGNIYYDDDAHVYTNQKGEVYMSGSQYAKSLEKPFDLERISQAMADKFGVEAKDIKDMWALKGEISTGFGTAIHKALELYGRFNGLATSIEKTTHLHDQPIIKKAVESFYEGRENEKAVNEVFIVDHEAKQAGQIDRLLLTGDKKCRVQDYKTNADIKKSLPTYWVQLEFYAGILEANGWTVEGNDIFHWNGEWETYSKER
jgi:hypothetical protein